MSIDALRRDPSWEERKRLLWSMTASERIAAMRAGRLGLRECLAWASGAPHEVPVVNGEWEFITACTPEARDDD